MDAPTPEPQRVTALDLELAILSVLRARGALTQDQVAAALGANPYTVNLALERLGRRRRVLRAGRTAAGPPAGGGGWGTPRWLTLWAAAPDAN